ncbi:RNA polymerase sigma factor [Caldilinea sp.]|jgi:RNA polymerase sigma factor (sigma-70 family)|uniref:RNA polymerase sigma factor n=1 Tax=Caldilinea sp. TaxID=2293560 RepID=UPI0026395EF8|nr:sigma-70 family RNA polymerase sigma factor [uncultured Caldilinea sp.]
MVTPKDSTQTLFVDADDAALVDACRRGDAAAWEALVYRFQRLIYAIPRRAGLDDEGCADVFQRTFALLVEHLDRISQPERVRAWLVTTARRETQRALQRTARIQPLVHETQEEATEESSPSLVDPAPLPDEMVAELEEQHIVRTALAKLDERCRQLLTLLFYSSEPATYEEISAQIGAPVGSIGPTRARCLKKLERLLKDSGFFMYFVGFIALCLNSWAIVQHL